MIYLKTPHQVRQIEYANQMVAEVLELCYEHIKPDVATIELEEIAERYCKDHYISPSFKGYREYPYCCLLYTSPSPRD